MTSAVGGERGSQKSRRKEQNQLISVCDFNKFIQCTNKKELVALNEVGRDPIERLRFLAPGTGAREGGEKTQLFECFLPTALQNNLFT